MEGRTSELVGPRVEVSARGSNQLYLLKVKSHLPPSVLPIPIPPPAAGLRLNHGIHGRSPMAGLRWANRTCTLLALCQIRSTGDSVASPALDASS